MSARRAVAAALKNHDAGAEAEARDRVQKAKEGLGERGPKWWEAEENTGRENTEKSKKA